MYLYLCYAISSAKRATIVSVVFAGQIIGSLIWGTLADRYGRRITYLVGCILISVGGVLSGAAPSYAWLLIFRGIVGFGVGSLVIPFDLLTEFLPPSHRGKYLNCIEFFWTIGSLLVAGMAWLMLNKFGWRALTYATAAPVGLTCVIAYMILPESPRWLLAKGRVKEAEEIVAKAAKSCNINLGNFTLVLNNDDAKLSSEIQETPPSAHDTTPLDLFKTKEMRRIISPLLCVWFCFGFAYYGIILFVSRLYETNDNGSCSFDYSAIFINSTSEFVGVLVGICIIDKVGRRKTQSGLYVLGGITILLISFKLGEKGTTVAAWFARMFAMGSSSATWIVTPELLPTDLRATGHSICNTAARFGAFSSPYFTSGVPIVAVAIGLACFNFAGAVASMCLPETTGLVLDSVIKSARDSKDSRHDSKDSTSLRQQLLNL